MDVAILCSVMGGLGTYVPALLIRRELIGRGLGASVFVHEAYLGDEARTRIDATRAAYHARFALALAGQRLARQLTHEVERPRLQSLLRQWADAGLTRFLVLSGYWLPALRAYQELVDDRAVDIEACHLDAITSTSWACAREDRVPVRDTWLFTHAPRRVHFRIPIGADEPVPFAERADRLVIHGGGWGLGTYRDVVAAVLARGLGADVVAYEEVDMRRDLPGCRYFLKDPAWKPWAVDERGRHRFPPHGEVPPGGKPVFDSRPDHHALFDLIVRSKAVVSKPGGATLIESFASGTPVVLLDPWGPHERANAELWEAHGFGISLPKWEVTGYSSGVLETLHRNLVEARARTPSYPEQYALRIEGRER